MDGKEAEVQHYNHTTSKKSVGVWKSPDGSMNNKVEVLIDKSKNWKR